MPVPNTNKNYENLQFDDLDDNFYFHLEDLQVKLFEEIQPFRMPPSNIGDL